MSVGRRTEISRSHRLDHVLSERKAVHDRLERYMKFWRENGDIYLRDFLCKDDMHHVNVASEMFAHLEESPRMVPHSRSVDRHSWQVLYENPIHMP